MNSTKNTTQFPQEIAIPQSLEIHPSVSEKGAHYLMAVAEAIGANPRNYDQSTPSICGGAMCIVGHLAVLAGLPLQSCGGVDVRTGIGNAVGLTIDQIEGIYWSDKWPASFRVRESQITPEMGIARIEHFLTHGE
jgi:hypothetical protein